MATMRPVPRAEEQEKRPRVIRSELNIERWSPMFTTSHFRGRSKELYRRLGDGVTMGVIVGKQLDHRGNVVEVGVLTVPALKVFYGLIMLWEQANMPVETPVSSTLPQLRRVLGKSLGGKEYEYLKVMLESLRNIPIRWIGSFYQQDEGRLLTIEDGFNILTTLQFREERIRGKVVALAFRYKFHERILNNLMDNYTKPLNFEAVLALKKELSVLLYCHVDLIMADKEHYERRTKELFENLGIEGRKYRYPSARKQNLEPALKELVGVRLSTGQLTQAYLQKTKDRKDWKAVFIKQPFRPALSHKPESEVRAMVSYMLEVLEDRQSEAFYTKVARLCPSNLIYMCLSEVKDDWLQGKVRKSKGALFTDKIKRYCKEKGIDLGLRTSK